MSSKFFSSREQRDNKEKVNQKNTAGNRQNFKRAAGVRKSGRGK
jgi:hypothetical protein